MSPAGALQTAADPRRARRLAGHAATPGVAVRIGLAATVAWIAFDGGSYNVSSWSSAGIVIWWAVAIGVAVGVWPRRDLGRAAVVVTGAFTAFALYSGISAVWASGAERPVEAMGRALLYVGVLVLALVAGTPRSLARWCDAIATGLSGIAILAVLSRLFHGSFGNDAALRFLPDATTRLSFPVEYWNGLAVVVALACPLLLRVATVSRHRLNALALAPIPVIAATIYLASSRSGAVTAFVGIGVFAVLAERRRVAVLAAAVSVSATAVTVIVVATQHALVNGPLDSAAAADDGRKTALALVLLAAATSAVYAALAPRVERIRIDRRFARGTAVVALAAMAVALAAAHPVAHWHSFTQPPGTIAKQQYIQNHFLSSNGNWRWQYWGSAVDEFRTKPLFGRGAGSFESWWAEHGRTVGFIGNPHSLYLETLGELGLVGLALLAVAFGTGALAAVSRTRRAGPAVRNSAAAVTAGAVAFAIAAGLDWMWELPAVAMVGLALIGLAVGPATAPESVNPQPQGTRMGMRAALALAAAAVLLLHVDLYAGDNRLSASRDAVARGDLADAQNAASQARSLEPWAAAPYTQLALIAETGGDLRGARRWIGRALAHDNRDWRLWLIDARIETKSGNIPKAQSSFERARSLNPRSPVFLSNG